MNERAEILAQHLISLAGVPHVPPVDIQGLAKSLGIRLSENVNLIEDGRVDVSEEGISIELRAGLSQVRRRFTLGHELGHLILPCPGRTLTARRSPWHHSDEERLCDEIAAALLMPRSWLQARYQSRVHNLSTIRHLAHQADVSIGAALVRLKELFAWPESLLRWRFEEGRWRFIAGAGIPPALHGEVRSAERTSEVLTAAGRSRRDRNLRIPIRIGSDSLDLASQVSVLGRSAVVLTLLPTEPNKNACA